MLLVPYMIKPLTCGRITLPTPLHRALKTASNDDCNVHVRPMPHKPPSPCVWSLCVWVERGPFYLILLHRDGARAVTYSRAHGDPSPPYTGRSGGVGTRKRERTWSAQSRDLLCHCSARSHDNPRWRGGGPTAS